MVTFNKLAAVSVLIISLAAAAPVRTPSSLGERIKCLALGCTDPEELHPFISGTVHNDGGDTVIVGTEKVEESAGIGSAGIVVRDELKTLVKDDIVKKPWEELVDDKRNDPGHGKRDVQKQLERPATEGEHDDTILTTTSPLHTTHSHENPESAQPDSSVRNPLLEAEDRLVNGLKSAVTEWRSDHGKN